VTSGATWRQVVDFGALGKSVGVYPGGQASHPEDPFVADQLALWARGEYAPLWFESDPGKIPSDAVAERWVFDPTLPERERSMRAPAPD
jgi:acyl-homoserine lactone acylase PvdQ